MGELLDLTSGTSLPGPDMNVVRVNPSATLLPDDGGVLVIGGSGDDCRSLATTEVLDVAGNTTSVGPELGLSRSSCSAVKLLGDRLLVIGGCRGTDDNTTEILSMPTKEGY